MRTLLFLSLFLIVAMTLALMPTTPVEGDGQRPSVGFFSFKGLVVITNPEAPPRAYPNQNANGQRVLEHFLKGNYQIPSNIISQNLLQGRSGKDNVPGQIPIYANDTIYTVTPDSVAHVNLNNGGLIWMTEISGIRIPDRVVNIPQNSNAYLAAQFGNVRVRVNNYRTRTDEYQVITPSTVAGVRGTEFMVGVAVTGSVNTMVFDGTVRVVPDDPDDAEAISENQGVSVDLGGRPSSTVTVSDPQQIQEVNAEFQAEETAVAEADPVGTMEQINTVMVKIKDGNQEAASELDDAAAEAEQIAESGAEALPEDSIVELEAVDATIATNDNRNEALQGLAAGIAEQNPDNEQVQQAYSQTVTLYGDNKQIREEFGDRIAAMSERIDRFVQMQEEKFDRFTGGELDF